MSLTLSATQQEAVTLARAASMMLLTGGPGSGKCLGLGTSVLHYDGHITAVEDVVPDDLLMGPDSTPRRVLSTCRGFGPLFRVVPKKGDPWVCNDVHVLTLMHSVSKVVWDVPLNEYVDLPVKTRHHAKLFQPERTRFPARSERLLVSPYFLGAWLGDGTKNLRDGTRISKPDREIETACRAEADRFGLRVTVVRSGSCPTYCIVGEKGRPNPLTDTLRALLDGHLHVPDAYKLGSLTTRAELLAGILDTDGHKNGGGYEISQRSVRLADDITFLARSIGLRVTRRTQVVQGQKYERLFLSGDATHLPLRIPRKAPDHRQQKKNALVVGFHVESIEDGEYCGFTLDGDGRFLLGDFTVTHNTTVLKTIVQEAKDRNESVLLLSPTGKAAARLTNATGRPAITIHRALEWDGGKRCFRRTERHPLEWDAVVVDEASMLDSHLADALLRACADSTRVIWCGDANQLPPVGPGSPFHDALSWGEIPTVRLRGVHRQVAGSPIIGAARSILQGAVPASKGTPGDDAGAFVVVVRPDAASVAETAVEVAARRLPARGFRPSTVQVLAARRENSPVSAEELNAALAPAMNPGAPAEGFWLHDRVVQTANDYEREVFNGQTGVVRKISRTGLTVRLDDTGADVDYGLSTLRQLQRAFCMTVHKSQGSEYDALVVALDDSAGSLLHRSLLYTAVTRAKKVCVVVATANSLQRAVETPTPSRATWLQLQLQSMTSASS